MKVKFLLLTIASLFLCLGNTSKASGLENITCDYFNTQNDSTQQNLIYLIDGVTANRSETTLSASEWLDMLYNHTSNFCRQYPSANLQTITETMPEYPNPPVEIDVAQIRCSEMAQMDENMLSQTLWWWVGFASENYNIDIASINFQSFGDSFGGFCEKLPNATGGDFIINYYER